MKAKAKVESERKYYKYQTPSVGYRELTFVSSSGSQYINTGFNSTGASRFTFCLDTPTNTGVIFGGYNTTWTDGQGLYTNLNSDTWIHYNSNEQCTKLTGTKNVVDINKGVYTVNGQVFKTYTQKTFNVNKPTYIFAGNMNGSLEQPTAYKLYYFKIYDNDVLVRDFVPCERLSDNSIGLYDKVNHLFYESNGGTLTKGEYIVVEATKYTYDFYKDFKYYKLPMSLNTLTTRTSECSNPNVILEDKYKGRKPEIGIETDSIDYSYVGVDKTPNPIVLASNHNFSIDFGTERYDWWSYSNGQAWLGAALGGGYQGAVTYQGRVCGWYDGSNCYRQNGNITQTYTFSTPLPPGDYKLKCASNGYTYTVELLVNGVAQSVALPSGLSSTEWKYTNTITVSSNITGIRASVQSYAEGWRGIGPVHLIQEGAWTDKDDNIIKLSDYQLSIVSGQPQTGDTITMTYTTELSPLVPGKYKVFRV